MFKIEAYIDDQLPVNDDVRVFGIFKNEKGKITANKEITHPTRDGDNNPIGQTFKLDKKTGETEKTLDLVMQDLNCETYDLDDVEPRVLVNLKWPKGLDYEITQTRSGWEVKLNLESLSTETQTKDVVQSGNGGIYTSVSVGVGNSG